jgi:hypothetical protein
MVRTRDTVKRIESVTRANSKKDQAFTLVVFHKNAMKFLLPKRERAYTMRHLVGS